MVDVLDESFYAAMNSAMVLYTASASGKSVRKLMYNHSNLNAQAEQVAQVKRKRKLTKVNGKIFVILLKVKNEDPLVTSKHTP